MDHTNTEDSTNGKDIIKALSTGPDEVREKAARRFGAWRQNTGTTVQTRVTITTPDILNKTDPH